MIVASDKTVRNNREETCQSVRASLHKMKNLLSHREMNNLQACVVKELETCTDPTPANIVDSIFNYIKKVTPCEGVLNAQSAAATGTEGSSGAPRVSGALTAVLVILSAIASSCSRQNYFLGVIA